GVCEKLRDSVALPANAGATPTLIATAANVAPAHRHTDVPCPRNASDQFRFMFTPVSYARTTVSSAASCANETEPFRSLSTERLFAQAVLGLLAHGNCT